MGGEEGGLEEEKERKIEEGGNDGRKGMVRGRDVERQTGRMGVLESEARDYHSTWSRERFERVHAV